MDFCAHIALWKVIKMLLYSDCLLYSAQWFKYDVWGSLHQSCKNPLWPTDTIWSLRSWSALAQVIDCCCLMAPSHYLNQYWLIISEVQWQSPKGNFTRDHIVFYSNPPKLSHWGQVVHICNGNLTTIGSDNGLCHCLVPSHYLNQCWNTVNSTIGNTIHSNLNWNSYIFIQGNAVENGVCKMAAILT